MPGTDDIDNELDDQNEEVEDDTEETGDDADASDDSDDTPAKDDKSEKRIKDLQSKFDAAEARANKAEKALKAASAGKGGDLGSDPVTQALMQEVREASLDAIYGEYPVLKEYGIDRSLIEGSTRSELRESANSLVSLIKSVSTKVRNQTLADNGIVAPASGSARKAPSNYATMSEEDFKKLLDSM